MKKILGMLSFAAMILVACEEENGGNTQDPADYNYTQPRLEAPANVENHFGLSVDQSKPQDGMKNPDGQAAKVTELYAPPGNTGTVQFNDGKAPREFDYQVSKVAAGTTLITDRVFDKLEISSVDGNAAVLKATIGGKEVVLQGNLIEAPYTPYRQDVCRTWEVETTFVIIKMNGKTVLDGVGGRFKGCKLSEISKEIADKNVKITPLSSDYDVRKVMIDPCGKFGIFFEGKDPYYGDYTLKGTEFSYDLQFYEEDNPVLSGKATGKLIATNGKGRLSFSADMKDNAGDKYTVDITLVMKTATAVPK
ncbi:MAG: hypothetical protein IKX37_01305 [Bacteroidales bacterium]|nr:hypothetical protein [Bacteroidales bacterium]